MGTTNFKISMDSASSLAASLSNGELFSINAAIPVSSPTDYSRLLNKPKINGVTVNGDLVSADLRIVSENTTAGWNADPTYIPLSGEIVIYTDVNNIKIGDGTVPVIDLPFVNQQTYTELTQALANHMADTVSHVSTEDRARWDAKLNYTVDGETIEFNRI